MSYGMPTMWQGMPMGCPTVCAWGVRGMPHSMPAMSHGTSRDMPMVCPRGVGRDIPGDIRGKVSHGIPIKKSKYVYYPLW